MSVQIERDNIHIDIELVCVVVSGIAKQEEFSDNSGTREEDKFERVDGERAGTLGKVNKG